MDQKNFLQQLGTLVSMQSTADNPAALEATITYAEKFLTTPALKIEKFVKNDKQNLLVYPAKSNSRTFDVILNAHLDVVPAAPSLFTLQVKGGKAYGRGVLDMKGAAVVLMQLYRDLAETGELGSVALTLVTDEEIGGHNGVKKLLEQEKVQGKFFLAGEPTNLGICYQQKGILWLELVEKGKAAHGSRPWEGVNANLTLAQKIADFYAKNPQPTAKDDWKTSYTLSILRGGGEAKNVVADRASAYLDVRRVQTEPTDAVLDKLRATFTDTDINIVMDEPCLDANPTDAFIQQLAQAVKAQTKQEAALTRETFGSDSRFYSAAGVTAINFGPSGGDMHGDAEWLDLASVETYYKIMKRFLCPL